jgi:ubiquinone/menaquinone biosynthesis C-methylase UbiE
MLNPISDISPTIDSDRYKKDEIPENSFLQLYYNQIQQDILINNEIIAFGTDHCASRYELIKPVLNRYHGHFSVLDVGAAQGYFSFSIARDFPDSHCVMIEANDTSYYANPGRMLAELCKLNVHLPNIYYLNKTVNIEDMRYLNENEHFDIIMAFIVLHRMENKLKAQIEMIQCLLSLGDNIILEVANDTGVTLTSYVEFLSTKTDCQYLGEVNRHKNPASTSTGKLFWFRSNNSATSGRQKHKNILSQQTFLRMNGIHPLNFQ